MRRLAYGIGIGFASAAAAWFLVTDRTAAGEPAPDPVEAYPDNYTVLLENEHVRVIDFKLRRGATEEAHAHPAHVAVFLADFQIRFTFPDGKTGIRNAKAGEVAYSSGATHASENIGDNDAHGILVELKPPLASGITPAAARLADPPAGALTAVTLIHGIPGKEDALLEHLLSLAAPTRAEEGCLRYDLYRSPDRKHEFMRYEAWTTPDALEAHKKAPHLADSWARRQREGWTTEILTWRRVPEDADTR